jgi:hypothetical protein
VILEPPLSVGAVNAILNDAFPGVVDNPVGAPGVVAGVADTEADAEPTPAIVTGFN